MVVMPILQSIVVAPAESAMNSTTSTAADDAGMKPSDRPSRQMHSVSEAEL